MRLSWIAIVFLSCNCNQPPPQPRTADQVFDLLVSAGCVMPDDAGALAVMHDSQRPDEPSWMKCVFDGGSVKACGVPCGSQ